MESSGNSIGEKGEFYGKRNDGEEPYDAAIISSNPNTEPNPQRDPTRKGLASNHGDSGGTLR